MWLFISILYVKFNSLLHFLVTALPSLGWGIRIKKPFFLPLHPFLGLNCGFPLTKPTCPLLSLQLHWVSTFPKARCTTTSKCVLNPSLLPSRKCLCSPFHTTQTCKKSRSVSHWLLLFGPPHAGCCLADATKHHRNLNVALTLGLSCVIGSCDSYPGSDLPFIACGHSIC